MEFDNIDRNILRLLQRDGTLSQTKLAQEVGASAASCWRRVNALEKAGALKATVRLADAQTLGLLVTVFCQLRLKNHLPSSSEAFEAFLDCRPEIVECYAISGDWDYLLRVVAVDVLSYETFLRKHLLANELVASASSTFALSQRKYTTVLPI